MKIAVEGCAHGELEKIYDALQLLEKKENVKIDLLICCGDFQSTRNLQDLRCMAVPPKYYNICTFYKYYSGEKVAPYLTIFIGGNHEASNYLQELPYGGWVAPNIYYLGYAGVINIAGVRIGGISGIYKGFDYMKGHYEKAPYSEDTKRSVYHIRSLEVFRLKQMSQLLDIFLSHDWPKGVYRHGNVKKLLKNKPFFKSDIDSDKLGSPPCEELLNHLKPSYWFAAHLHCKFAALVPHTDETNDVKKVTKFLALDKCLPKRKFLQIVDIPHESDSKIEIKYDLEWLTVLFLTNHLLSVKNCSQYMPGPGSSGRWIFTPTQEEKDFVLEKFDYDLTVPKNFTTTVPAYSPADNQKNISQPSGQINRQAHLFCEKLGIDDPTYLILSLDNKSFDENNFNFPQKDSSILQDSGPFTPRNSSPFIPRSVELNQSRRSLILPDPKESSLTKECGQFSPKSSTPFIPRSVELNQNRLNQSLPDTKVEFSSPSLNKLSLTLPPPKNDSEEMNFSSTTTTETSSQESDVSDSSLNASMFCDMDALTSTPQAKKFKRRNESIYKMNCNT